MFHYPTAPSYFVDPYEPYAYHQAPFYTSGRSRLSQAQRQRELYHEQRRRALAMEAQRRERQVLAYEQQLREQEWARRMGYSPLRNSRPKEHYVHSDCEEDCEDNYDSESELREEESSRQRSHSPQPSTPKASTSRARSGVSIPITEPRSYGLAEEEAATTLQKHFRARVYRRQAIAALQALSKTFTDRSNVELPTLLHIADTGKVAYDSHNAPFHAYEDALVKLLTQLDEVSTKGDDKIKMARKALVRKIEKELNRLDQIKELSLAQARSPITLPELEDADSKGKEVDKVEEEEEEWQGITSGTETETEDAGDIEPLV